MVVAQQFVTKDALVNWAFVVWDFGIGSMPLVKKANENAFAHTENKFMYIGLVMVILLSTMSFQTSAKLWLKLCIHIIQKSVLLLLLVGNVITTSAFCYAFLYHGAIRIRWKHACVKQWTI